MEDNQNEASSAADNSEATPPPSESSNDTEASGEESVPSPDTTSVVSSTTRSDQSEGNVVPHLRNREISSNLEPQVREAEGNIALCNTVNYLEMEAVQGGANSEAAPALPSASADVNPDSPPDVVSSSTDPIVNELSSTTLMQEVVPMNDQLNPDESSKLPNLSSRNESMDNPSIATHENDQPNLEQGVANLRICPDNSSVSEVGEESTATSSAAANVEPLSQEQKDVSNESNSLKPVTETRNVKISPKRKSTGEFATSQASTSESVSTQQTKQSNRPQANESPEKEQVAFFEKGKNIRKRASPKSSPSRGCLKKGKSEDVEEEHHSPAKKPKPPPSEDADKINPEDDKKGSESGDNVGPIKKLKFESEHSIASDQKSQETEKSEASKTVVADNNVDETIRDSEGQEGDSSKTENPNKEATSETDSNSHDEETSK